MNSSPSPNINPTDHDNKNDRDNTTNSTTYSATITYEITGKAAHDRIRPLLPQSWIDCTHDENSTKIDFLWENTSRASSRGYRDNVKCYSHLPNGRCVLDDKWSLARLLSGEEQDQQDVCEEEGLNILESFCFRGISGLCKFYDKVGMLFEEKQNFDEIDNIEFPDLIHSSRGNRVTLPRSLHNTWVIKDTCSNGAGGIWMVSPQNAHIFLGAESPLIEHHKYIVQRYAYPMVLYNQRKCHVRVYALLTCDEKAFVHNRAFLHVANDVFELSKKGEFEETIHVTNCCANSHDDTKFSGEICASLADSSDDTVDLSPYSKSIHASVRKLAERAFSFLKGGDGNGGFEYLGLDFILSHDEYHRPIAYLLEVNAPPSQDTATGLHHAERLHDDVLRDLLSLWVFPRVLRTLTRYGGWECVYQRPVDLCSLGMLPSKAVLLNKIRWAIYERKMLRLYDDHDAVMAAKQNNSVDVQEESVLTDQQISAMVRMHFPYFEHPQKIFFENAGGAQVPYCVINAVAKSLSTRHRNVIGKRSKELARSTLLTLLGASPHSHEMFLGCNATSLLHNLAQCYLSVIAPSDEILIAEHNHQANITPWLQLATHTTATVQWWNTTSELERLVSPNTRLVICSHASNIYGKLYDLQKLCSIVRQRTSERTQIVVDGVTAAPHSFADLSSTDIDFYTISMHKLCAPHLGALCAKKRVLEQISNPALEMGTISYEACAGATALGYYFYILATSDFQSKQHQQQQSCNESSSQYQNLSVVTTNSGNLPVSTAMDNDFILSIEHVQEAYRRIQIVEMKLVHSLFSYFTNRPRIQILREEGEEANSLQNNIHDHLPILCILHQTLQSSHIVEHCYHHGIICRNGSFLSPRIVNKFLEEDNKEGVVRFSLLHYNTQDEIRNLISVLELMDGW